MKRLKISFLFLALFTLYVNSFSFTANAADSKSITCSAKYDLTIGGTHSFQLTDNKNNMVIITITEEENITRLENKTYSVSFKSPLAWEAGYKVVINNNSITSVHSAWNKPILGTILSPRLVKESSKQATYYFTYQLLGVATSPGVRTLITGTTMEVFNI